jgi:hypothetical protein
VQNPIFIVPVSSKNGASYGIFSHPTLEITRRTSKATTTSDVLHETPPRQRIHFHFTPSWLAQPATIKHSLN